MGRIKDLILGSGKEQSSVRVVNELGGIKGQLSYEQQTRLNDAFSTWVRLRARQALMLSGMVAGGGLIAAVLTGEPSKNSSEPTPSVAVAPNTQKDEEPPVITEADALKRLEETEAWLKTLETLVEKTKNPEAKAILDFITSNGIVGLPVSVQGGRMGIKVLGQPESNLWLNVVPLVKGDASLKGDWSNYTAIKYEGREFGSVANFLPDMKAIILKGYAPTSDVFKGIIFAHEGFHAKAYITAPYNWGDRQTFCKKEREAHDFENTLMIQLGGATYQTVLNDEITRMTALLAVSGVQAGEFHVPRAGYDSRLDQAFGPSASPYEQDFRQTQVWIHANFEMIEGAFPEPIAAEEEKAKFYCTTRP